PSETSHVYLLDDAGRLIVTNAPKEQRIQTEEMIAQDVSLRKSRDFSERSMVLRVNSLGSGWSLLLIQPESEIYKKSRPLQIFSYWIILISCLLEVWISWLIYSSIASPIS